MLKLDSIFELAKAGIPALLDIIKVFFSKKKYTKEEIDQKAKSELEALQDWKKSSEEDRKIIAGQ